jgi:hypothetical protein
MTTHRIDDEAPDTETETEPASFAQARNSVLATDEEEDDVVDEDDFDDDDEDDEDDEDDADAEDDELKTSPA